MLKVYLIQIDSDKANKSGNIARAKKMILDARPDTGSLILLPEMFATGYVPTDLDAAAEDFRSSVAGETARMLSEVATATDCTIMGAGITKADSTGENKFFNHVSVYEPGNTQEVACYDKMNLFFPEKECFKAGGEINLFNIKEIPDGSTSSPTLVGDDNTTVNWRIASFICYDLRFPELFREATKQGANLITVQAAWPAKRRAHWETLLKARAIENQVYIAAVNAVSENHDPKVCKVPLAGTSLIISPNGDVLAEGSLNKEEILTAILDLQAEKDLRKTFPVLEGIVEI